MRVPAPWRGHAKAARSRCSGQRQWRLRNRERGGRMRVVLWEMYRDAVHSRHRAGPLRESAPHRLGRIPLIYNWPSDIRWPCCVCVCECVYLVHFERAVLTADYCSFTSLLSVCFAAATPSHHCRRQVLFDDQCGVAADIWA